MDLTPFLLFLEAFLWFLFPLTGLCISPSILPANECVKAISPVTCLFTAPESDMSTETESIGRQAGFHLTKTDLYFIRPILVKLYKVYLQYFF